MKKNLFKAIILALMVTFGITSCSQDDYDDAPVTANATAITTLQSQLTTLNNQLTALQGAQDALATSADVDAAKSEASAANAALLADVTASIKALETSTTDAIATLTTGTATDIANLKASLEAKIAANAAAIDANATAIAANAANATAADLLISSNTADIATLQSDLTALAAQVSNNSTLIAQINDAIAAIEAIDAAHMLTGLTVVTSANDYIVDNNEKYTTLSCEYIMMNNSAPFGINGDMVQLQKAGMNGYYFATGKVTLQTNPKGVDLTSFNLALANSVSNIPGISFTTAKNMGPIIRMSTPTSVSEDYWDLTVNMDDSILIAESNKANANDFFDTYFGNYALSIYAEKDGRVMPSDNHIAFKRTPLAIPTAYNYTVAGSPANFYNETPANGDYITISNNANNKGIYKQYVTLSDPANYDAADFMGVNELLNGDEDFKIACNNVDYVNDDISVDIHYLNYDGSRGVVTKTIKFTQKIYEDAVINLTAVINRSTVNQTTDTVDIASAIAAQVPNIATWVGQFDNVKIEAASATMGSPKFMLPTLTPINILDNANAVNSFNVDNNYSFVGVTADELTGINVTFNANDITKLGTYGAKLSFYNGTNLVNIVNINVEVKDTDKGKYVSKVTSAWNAALTQNNIWAQINPADETISTYNMVTSYNNLPSQVSFATTESDITFTGSAVAISPAMNIAAQPNQNYAVKSVYTPFNAGVWEIEDDFTMHVRSPIYEATPALDQAYSLEYTNALNGSFTLDASSITAVDPSASNNTISYIGVANTGRDIRIASTEFKIVDPDATSLSSNLGLVTIDNTIDPTSITIERKANSLGEYPSLDGDVTLNLVMIVTDKFGFVQTSSFPFTVKRTMHN